MRFSVIRISFTFIDFHYWGLFWDSLFYCLAFCGNQLFEFYRSSTDWLSHDAGSGCGESWNRLLTVLYLFFFFVYLCFAFVWLFHGYLLRTFLVNFLDDIYFNRSFNWYIGNFLIELHFIFIAFILILTFLLCFWSCSGRYSFYTFCLMHSLKKVFEQTEI